MSWILLSVGVILKLDRSISVNIGFATIGVSIDGVLVLDVLVIDGDPLSEVELLKGDVSGLKVDPVICLYLDVVDVGVDVPVTGVNAGRLFLPCALLYCSSLEVVVSCLSCFGSDSELSSGAVNL